MGTIIVSEFTTLDGVIGTPTFTYDYEFVDSMAKSIAGLTDRCEAILFGRKNWVESGPAWSGRDMADDPGAPFFNDTPKYVVSSTLDDVGSWANSHLLGPYGPDAIQKLKDSVDGGIYLYGSGTLVRALIADGLVDELHLFLFPLAVGDGPRLFPEGGPNTKMSLLGVESFENGATQLSFGPVASSE